MTVACFCLDNDHIR